MNYSLGNDLYIEMMNWEFIKQNKQFNIGVFMNEERIGPVPIKKSPTLVNVFDPYALAVMVNDQLKPEPNVAQGFGYKDTMTHPMKKGPYELL